jgi:putative ABC transport system substrate-binding protein
MPRKFRWGSVILAAVVLLIILTLVRKHPSSDTRTVVGVIEPMQHIAVSDITRGLRDGLADNSRSYNILVANANGDQTTIPQIVGNFEARGVQVYVPIFTSTAQAVATLVTTRLIVFAAVTDPISAHLLQNADHPNGRITGVSDLWPIGAQLDVVRTLLPSAKTIGLLHDPGDPSSAVTLPIVERAAAARKFRILAIPVHAATEIQQALSTSIGNADVIYTANDVTVTSGLPAVVSFCIRHQIPFFAGDYSSVERGAIAAIGQNYYAVGLETAKIIGAIRLGKKTSEIPVTYTSGGDLYINRRAAKLMGVELPASLIAHARQVYDQISNNTSK